jgi:hypothetical protein
MTPQAAQSCQIPGTGPIGISVGREGEGAVYHRLRPGAFQNGPACIFEFNAFVDLIELIWQDFMDELAGRRLRGIGFAPLIV